MKKFDDFDVLRGDIVDQRSRLLHASEFERHDFGRASNL